MLYFGQRASDDESVHDTLVGIVAGVVALVPQGLVLLLSMAQAVAVIRLGRKKVLVQRLQAVETLARITVLASDKTGTLTTGAVKLEKVEPLAKPGADGTGSAGRTEVALAAMAAADEFPNATMKAIRAAHPDDPGWPVAGRIPFDSAHKYSAVEFQPGNAWYVGAPEILLPRDHPEAGGSNSWPAKGSGCCCSPRRPRCRPRARCRRISRPRPSSC